MDLSVKKFVFKMISEIAKSSNSSKVSIDSLWRKYFDMPDVEQKNASTGKDFLTSKEDLKRVLEQMEADDLTMLDGNDVILTN